MRFRNSSGQRIRFEEGGPRMNDAECCCVTSCEFTYDNTDCDFVFTYTGTGGTTFLWDFGDGGTSTSENPSHSYPGDGGTFLVRLTVDGEHECEATVQCGNTFTCHGYEIANEPLMIVAGVTDGSCSLCSGVNGVKVLSLTTNACVLTYDCLRSNGQNLGTCNNVCSSPAQNLAITVGFCIGYEPVGNYLRGSISINRGTCDGTDAKNTIRGEYRKVVSPVDLPGSHTLDLYSTISGGPNEFCDNLPATITVIL